MEWLDLAYWLGAWSGLAVSLFNMLLLIWLGITVFFTAEKRTWGLRLILGGMVMGSLFFASHSMIIGNEATHTYILPESDYWWHIGWIPVIFTPLIWYLIILWYTGYWDKASLPLSHRHQLPLLTVGVYAMILLGLLLFTRSLPTYEHTAVLYLIETDNIGSVPLLFLLYPPYELLTILLPIDALRHPQPSQRMMGDLARTRARKWLMRVSVVMLAVSVLVTCFVFWIIFSAFHWVNHVRSDVFLPLIAVFDLVIAFLVAIMIIMLGQAVISYEIFTGKALPRKGFQRHWRNAIIAAAGTAMFISFSIVFRPAPIYSLTILGIILMVFFALLSWRSFVHRDYLMRRLRPFINSQGSARQLFHVICTEMLHCQTACLLPMIPPLANQPIFFQTPHDVPPLPTDIQCSPEKRIVALPDGKEYQWVIPLWSTHGFVGALFIGSKVDKGLYTQEEIDAASAGAERIIELLTREELGRRVLGLERRRQTQQRIIDRQARRMLHDEILPDLHLAILEMAESPTRTALIAAHHKISDLIHNTAQPPVLTVDSQDVVEILRCIVHDEFDTEFDQIAWTGATQLHLTDDLTREVVVNAAREIIRNAAKHGRGSASDRQLSLKVCAELPATITITDNGVGQTQPWYKDNGGLALHSTMLAIVGGELQINFPSEGGTQVKIIYIQDDPTSSEVGIFDKVLAQ